MCLILLAVNAHPRYPLVLAANRDEFLARPTRALHPWEDGSGIMAGRDLQEGGTWFGVTKEGRWAAVTNYREPGVTKEGAPSRGRLVTDYLRSDDPAEEYLRGLLPADGRFNGFNLLAGDFGNVFYLSNRKQGITPLGSGVYGLSNHLLDTPWPKVVHGKERLSHLIRADRIVPENLFSLLADAEPAPDALLPDTGVGLEWERVLSPLFIRHAGYGTRSSTVLLYGADRRVTLAERTYSDSSPDAETRVLEFGV